MKKFKLNPSLVGKETYTKGDFDTYMTDVEGFVGVNYISKEEHKAILDELNTYKAEKRTNQIKETVKGISQDEAVQNKIIKYVKFEETDTDEIISKKVKEFADEWGLIKTPEDSVLLNNTNKPNQPETKNETSTQRKFVQ